MSFLAHLLSSTPTSSQGLPPQLAGSPSEECKVAPAGVGSADSAIRLTISDAGGGGSCPGRISGEQPQQPAPASNAPKAWYTRIYNAGKSWAQRGWNGLTSFFSTTIQWLKDLLKKLSGAAGQGNNASPSADAAQKPRASSGAGQSVQGKAELEEKAH